MNILSFNLKQLEFIVSNNNKIIKKYKVKEKSAIDDLLELIKTEHNLLLYSSSVFDLALDFKKTKKYDYYWAWNKDTDEEILINRMSLIKEKEQYKKLFKSRTINLVKKNNNKFYIID
jgi:hypothetical protein